MTWICVDTDLPGHPKLTRLARRLQVEPDAALALLVRLWCWVGKYGADGDLARFTDEEIAEGSGWNGAAKDFTRALDVTGFIEHGRVHDWYEYAGRFIALLERNRNRQQRHRNVTVTLPRNVTVTHNQPTDQPNNKPVTHSAADAAANAAVKATKAAVRTAVQAEFDQWWHSYPSKREKRKALPLYHHWRSEGASAEELAEARDRYLHDCDLNGRSYKYPATFLARSGVWRDWLETTPQREKQRNDGRLRGSDIRRLLVDRPQPLPLEDGIVEGEVEEEI